MKRREFLGVLAGFGLSIPLSGLAQSKDKTAHIGLLVTGSYPQRSHFEQALLAGLREQGYVEGKNLVLERRYANRSRERLLEFAQEFADMKLDAVVTTCTPSTRAAKQAMASTPIVMAAVADPVGQKLIASLARPGANITGLSSQAEDILPKMMELFASVLPKSATVAVFADSRSGVHPRMWQALGPIAQALNLKLVKVEAASPVDLPAAFDRAVRDQADAIFVLPDEPLFINFRAKMVELAAKHRLPAFYGAREFVDDGGLMSYGENLPTAYRHAASYVHKVVRGTAVGDLPVEQPTRFELVINLEAARNLGLKVPQALLLRADKVIR